MEIIKVENLYTAFGDNIVHENLSFNVKEGEIFGVLGGSGSGKTVLVKQIVMLNEIQKGTIKFFDKDISNLSLKEIEDVKLKFSYLFQFGALYSFLNVIENIGVMLKEYTNLPKDLIEKISYTYLDIVGLPKRVALARSLAMQPKILFLDEPTSGLDPGSTKQINELLLYLKNSLNITTVIITHDLETIKTVLDRFIIIKKEIIFDGDINAAMDSSNKFVQEFLTNTKDA